MYNILFLFVIFVICLINNGQDQKSRRNCIVLCGVFLVLVAGLRSGDSDNDTVRYLAHYLENGKMSYSELLRGEKDPVFFVFSRFLYTIFNGNYTLYFITLTVIFQIPVSKLIYDYSPNMLLSHTILLSMGFFHFSMTGMRQSIAIAFVVWAMTFLLKGSIKKAIIATLLGGLFHKSAIFFIIGILLAKNKVNYKSIFIYAFLLLAFIVFGGAILTNLLSIGQEYSDDARFGIYSLDGAHLKYTGLFQLLIFFALSFFFTSRALRNDDKYKILLNMMILAVLMQSLAIYIAEFFRVAMFFSIFMIISVPIACKNINNKALTIGLECFLMFYYILLYGSVRFVFIWS